MSQEVRHRRINLLVAMLILHCNKLNATQKSAAQLGKNRGSASLTMRFRNAAPGKFGNLPCVMHRLQRLRPHRSHRCDDDSRQSASVSDRSKIGLGQNGLRRGGGQARARALPCRILPVETAPGTCGPRFGGPEADQRTTARSRRGSRRRGRRGSIRGSRGRAALAASRAARSPAGSRASPRPAAAGRRSPGLRRHCG
jgi:hypothetical protein